MPSPLPSLSAIDSSVPAQAARELERSPDGSETPFAGLMAQYTAPPQPVQPAPAESRSGSPSVGMEAAESPRNTSLRHPEARVEGGTEPRPSEQKGPTALPNPAEGVEAPPQKAAAALPQAQSPEAPAPASLPLPAAGAAVAPGIALLPGLPEAGMPGSVKPPPPTSGATIPTAPTPTPAPLVPPVAPTVPSSTEASGSLPTAPAAPPEAAAAPVSEVPAAERVSPAQHAQAPATAAPAEPLALSPQRIPPPTLAPAQAPTDRLAAPAKVDTATAPGVVAGDPQGDAMPVQADAPETARPHPEGLPKTIRVKDVGSEPISNDAVPASNPKSQNLGQRGPTLLETPSQPPLRAGEPASPEPANIALHSAIAPAGATLAPKPGRVESPTKDLSITTFKGAIQVERSLAPVFQAAASVASFNLPELPVKGESGPSVAMNFQAASPEPSALASASAVATAVALPALPASPSLNRNPANALRSAAPIQEPTASNRAEGKENKDAQSKPDPEPSARKTTAEGASHPAPDAPKGALDNPAPTPLHSETRLPATPLGTTQSLGIPVQSGNSAAAIIPATPSAPAHPVAIQVGDSLKWILRQTNPYAELQLHPENLGKVTIQLKVDGTQVHAKVWATEASTLPVLQDHRAYLEVSLRQQGLNLGSFDLQQGHRGHQPQGEAPSRSVFAPTLEEKAAIARQETPSAVAPLFASSHRIEVLV